MKRKSFLIYFLSGFIPLLIFLVCAFLSEYIPFGTELLNIYDSFTQYPGMLLEYKNLLLSGNLFYSWNAGLGFNFFGTLTYYTASPLNLLCVFANTVNYPFFIAGMTYLRVFLLGLAMCFYLKHKNVRPLYIVLFSSIYALMGYTSSYYYNYLWIDSIIMLPFIIHGLDTLIEKNKPGFYLGTLAFTILINYYIGYMICIFCLVYFLYKMVGRTDKKKLFKTFAISSLLAGLIGAVVIIPSYFALMTGKADLYSTTDFSGINRNAATFVYTLTSGAYQSGDQSYGPAQVYSSILVVILTIFYFFNTKYSKKQKIATLVVLLFFYLSFSVNILNYAWHFFQKPIWWQSRFSFVFSFFLITLAIDVLENIDKTKITTKQRLIFIVLFIVACIVGAYFKWQVVSNLEMLSYVYLGISIMLFIELIFLVDKKFFLPLIVMFTFIDISLNTFNATRSNRKLNSFRNYSFLKEDLPPLIEELNAENDGKFYRFELMNDYISNDGMYFNYHGINYFNSVRNTRVTDLMEKLGVYVADRCHITIKDFDPIVLSLLNIKYLYGHDMHYFSQKDNSLYENPYPLSIGFMTNENIKSTSLDDKKTRENLSKIINDMTKQNLMFYKYFGYENFTLEDLYLDNDEKKIKFSTDTKKGYATMEFVSDGHYLLIPANVGREFSINDEVISNPNYYIELNENDDVKITFKVIGELNFDKLYYYLLDLDAYEKAMKILSSNLMEAKVNTNGHILEGKIDVTSDELNYLFTSIEYEEGMTVYVDGKKVKPDILFDALIGLKLEKGTHEIVIDYIPKGLISGSILSGISLVLSTFYLQRTKKKL